MISIRSRVDCLRLEEDGLAPYASKSLWSIGRLYKEQEGECDLRTPYQRDIGRIIHSAAFRRLQYKTQVFTGQVADFCRNRLTHTLAVSQIARTIARALKVNEDLTEAIALAHDIGHAPFGHVGEDVLNKLMACCGGFEHNTYALRVVDYIEFRTSRYPGLNLNYEVREGIARHSTEHDNPPLQPEFSLFKQPSIEAQVVNAADAIAYSCHDLEDGLMLGYLDVKFLDKNGPELWQVCSDSTASYEDKIIGVPRRIIDFLVKDLLSSTAQKLASYNIWSSDDVRNCDEPVVDWSEDVKYMVADLGSFLAGQLYNHPKVLEQRALAENMLTNIFEDTVNRLRNSENNEHYSDDEKIYIQACDIVASLTDRAVIRWFESPVSHFFDLPANQICVRLCS